MHLEAFDNTKLVAFNTCPTLGVLRYQMHRTMPYYGRSMPLEAGQAMHEVFAYVRLVTLFKHDMDTVGKELADARLLFNAQRMFGVERWDYIQNSDGEDWDSFIRNAALRVLESGGFYDDDRDQKRTITNLEECSLAYVDRWNWDHKVWCRDNRDPHSDIGVEIPYDLTVEVVRDDGDPQRIGRFTGKIDGIRWHRGNLTIEDNKTTGFSFTDAWDMQWETSQQITGYMIAASVFAGHAIHNAEVQGLRIPMPKSMSMGVTRVPTSREEHHFHRWANWFATTMDGYKLYKDNPMGAPMFTHSCHRYFRACQFIPFCVADRDEQQQILTEMDVKEWSPLHEVGDTE